MNDTTAVILGYDAVSPLGIDLPAQWKKALRGESGIGPLTRFPADADFPVHVAGEVDGIDDLSHPFLKPREQARWRSPIFKNALLTVVRALEKSGIEITPDLGPRVAVTYSSAIGGMDVLLEADRRLVESGALPPPFVNPNSCINMVGGRISMYTGACGPVFSTISACATGLTSMLVAAQLMATGQADLAICGAVDFPLVPPIVAGFVTMNAAFQPKEGAPPEAPESVSRPFSVNRRGFVVSEGAGCVVLATKDFAKAHGLSHAFELAGWCMNSDAHHYVAPHLPTVTRCIAESLRHAGLPPSAVDAVNAHAASTRVGDLVEHQALRAVFGERIPPVTAHKSLIGHAMGASSAIEVIFALMGMAEGRLPPTINLVPDPEIDMDVVTGQDRRVDQEYVLKNAFGFGGCNACAVIRRVA